VSCRNNSTVSCRNRRHRRTGGTCNSSNRTSTSATSNRRENTRHCSNARLWPFRLNRTQSILLPEQQSRSSCSSLALLFEPVRTHLTPALPAHAVYGDAPHLHCLSQLLYHVFCPRSALSQLFGFLPGSKRGKLLIRFLAAMLCCTKNRLETANRVVNPTPAPRQRGGEISPCNPQAYRRSRCASPS